MEDLMKKSVLLVLLGLGLKAWGACESRPLSVVEDSYRAIFESQVEVYNNGKGIARTEKIGATVLETWKGDTENCPRVVGLNAEVRYFFENHNHQLCYESYSFTGDYEISDFHPNVHNFKMTYQTPAETCVGPFPKPKIPITAGEYQWWEQEDVNCEFEIVDYQNGGKTKPLNLSYTAAYSTPGTPAVADTLGEWVTGKPENVEDGQLLRNNAVIGAIYYSGMGVVRDVQILKTTGLALIRTTIDPFSNGKIELMNEGVGYCHAVNAPTEGE
jgi:hypothetical protein